MGVKTLARRYLVRGRVQGVGYRYFVQRHASELGLRGYARNLEDGRVEVYAIGVQRQLSELEGLLWQGPMWAEVRAVEARDAALEECRLFGIER
ncbi:MAG: acylphosphatase [Acidobacteria bacterium]|nr:acylphosphatase [Acidobacteriota bacterium]